MIDINYIKSNPEEVIARLAKKGKDAKQEIEQILALDTERRALIMEGEALKAEQNKINKQEKLLSAWDDLTTLCEMGQEEDDPDLCVNPSNSIIRRNISYPGKLFDCALEIDGRARQFSHIEDPLRLDTLDTDFPGAASGDYTMAENAAIFDALPDFEPIPFAKIGRFKA